MKKNIKLNDQAGYLMIGVLGLITVVAILSANMNVSLNNAVKATSTVNLVNDRYYEVEKAISEVNNWLQQNTTNLGAYFDSANFGTYFVLKTNEDVLGTNEVANFGVPTRVRVKTTGNLTPMISNNSQFGTSNFPSIGSFNPVTSFNTAFPNASNGGVNMKLTLIWAENNLNNGYNPVFRIDAITGNNPDRGIHLYANIVGNFSMNVFPDVVGTGTVANPETSYMRDYINFFGQNSVDNTGSSTCKSANWTYSGGAWARGADGSNCIISSTTAVTLGGSGYKVYGGVYSPQALSATTRAKITNNNALAAECPNGGCVGLYNPLRARFDRNLDGTVNSTDYSWAQYCPNNGTKVCPVGSGAGGTNPANCDITVSANTVFNLPAGCYDTVTIANKGTLKLNELTLATIDATMKGKDGNALDFSQQDLLLSTLPYPHSKAIYIRSMSLSGGQAAVTINPGTGDDGTFVDAYVEVWNGNINGGQLVNSTAAPYKLRLMLAGNSITLNGTAQMNAHIVAPFQNSVVTTSGTFDFYGSLKAYGISATGNGKLFADGTGGNLITIPSVVAKLVSYNPPTKVYSITFDTYKISQKFR